MVLIGPCKTRRFKSLLEFAFTKCRALYNCKSVVMLMLVQTVYHSVMFLKKNKAENNLYKGNVLIYFYNDTFM